MRSLGILLTASQTLATVPVELSPRARVQEQPPWPALQSACASSSGQALRSSTIEGRTQAPCVPSLQLHTARTASGGRAVDARLSILAEEGDPGILRDHESDPSGPTPQETVRPPTPPLIVEQQAEVGGPWLPARPDER